MAIIGEFEGVDRSVSATFEMVANVNSAIASRAERQVFSPDMEFFYCSPGRKIRSGRSLTSDFPPIADQESEA